MGTFKIIQCERCGHPTIVKYGRVTKGQCERCGHVHIETTYQLGDVMLPPG